MVFYDEYDEIIGVDRSSIDFFGCSDIDEFKKDIDDVSNLFIKKDGYVYKFDHYTWLDFINYSQESINKVLIAQKNGDIVEAEVIVNEIFPTININNSKIIYGVEFVNPTIKEYNKTTDNDKHNEINIIKTDDKYLQNENKITLDREKNSKKLDVSKDFYDELLHDFFEEHDKYIKLIENYIYDNHYEEVLKIIFILKSICSNLKLNNLIPVLKSIEKDIKNKNYKSLQKFLEIYKKDVDLLRKS